MASPTTADSGDQSRPRGSSAEPSPPTGPQIASASSKPELSSRAPYSKRARRRRARKRPSGQRLFAFDRQLGARLVAGADEAGRGCLAGPLVAAAVMFDYERLTSADQRALAKLNDSKQSTSAAREELYPLILSRAARVTVISRCVSGIDTRGLHKTNLAALRDALRGVTAGVEDEVLCLTDGFAITQFEREHRPIVGGDATSAVIAAASIVAKVSRDRYMKHADELHPGWSFAEHVGYSTPVHREAIERRGVSPLHRMSFQSTAYQQLAL